MSWSTVKSSGSGPLAFRLMILGHPYEFVSSARLAGASTDGRERLAGLNARDIQWSEMLDPSTCKLTARGFTASIVEDGAHRTGDSFVRVPSGVYYLAASMTSVTTTMSLSAAGPANGTVLYVGSECVLVTAGGGTATLTVTRGYRQTRATAHPLDSVLGLTRPEVTTSRPSIEGQVAYLYAYGDGETGDGTVVWRGIVATQPRLRDLTTWEITLDSVTSILEQSLSADLQEPPTLRGIVYNARTAPEIELQLMTGATFISGSPQLATIRPESFATFYETQDEFLEDLNTLIRTATSAWTQPLNVISGALPALIAQSNGAGSWELIYTPNAATPRWLVVRGAGEIDPSFRAAETIERVSDGVGVFTVTGGIAYRVQPGDVPAIAGAGQVPRGFIGNFQESSSTSVYVGGTATIQAGDALTLAWPAFDTRAERGITYAVEAWDSSTRAATVGVNSRISASPTDIDRFYTPAGLPTLSIQRTYTSAGSFSDFIDALVVNSPDQAPFGRQPSVTLDHVDITTCATNIAAVAAGRPWLTQRYYGGTSDVQLGKLMTEEAKLLGMVPAIDTAGALVYVEFRAGAATEPTTYSVTPSTNLSGAQAPGWEPNAHGSVNTIQLNTGFDPISGKQLGDKYYVRDSAALSRNPLPSTLKIEPRSSYFGDLPGTIPIADVVALAQTWLGVLGAAYTTVTIACPLSAADATIGTLASITVSQLPDTLDGGRGVASLPGVVIGRSVKPLSAVAELTVLTTALRIAGYAPSSAVTSVTAAGGGLFDVLLDLAQPTGYATAVDYQVGDIVALRQYNTAAPTQITATVTVVTPGTRTVRIGSLSGGVPAGTLTLEYALAGSVTTSQQRYAFAAGDDDLIGFSVLTPARQFAA